MGSKAQHGDYSNLLAALRERIPCCVAASYFVKHDIALTVEGYEDLVAVAMHTLGVDCRSMNSTATNRRYTRC